MCFRVRSRRTNCTFNWPRQNINKEKNTMTAHELAKKLLEGPDLPVLEYSEDDSVWFAITGVAMMEQDSGNPVPFLFFLGDKYA